MLEIIKIKKDIEFILKQLKCLVKKNCSCAEENGALMPGDNVSALVNDAGYVTGETVNQNLQEVLDEDNVTATDIILGDNVKVKSLDGKRGFKIGPNYTRVFAYAGDGDFPDTEARFQVESNGAVVIQGESAQINIKEALITSQDTTFRGLEYSTDNSANFTDRSLVDKGYVLSLIPENLIEVTYEELVALVTTSTLTPGQTYLLTDYETTYLQPISEVTKASGVIEPLYLVAADVNKLHNECRSQLYPQDIVYYEVTGIIDENNGTEGFTKGKIYRRIDTIYNNDIGTDWRHITYRRYTLNVTNTYVVGNNYSVGDVVVSGTTIMICMEEDLASPSLDVNKWFEFPFSNGQYRSYSPNTIQVRCATFDFDDVYAMIPVNSLSYQDYTLLNSTTYVDGNITDNVISSTFLNNTVFLTSLNKTKITNNLLNNTLNSIGYSNISLQFRDNFCHNITNCNLNDTGVPNDTFDANMLKCTFEGNTINGRWSANKVSGTRISLSTFERDFTFNVILNSNIYGSNFDSYSFGNLLSQGTVSYSKIGTNFYLNNIKVPVIQSTIEQYFRYHTIEDSTVSLTNWKIDNYVEGPLTIPTINGEQYQPNLYKSNGSCFIKYQDEFGDINIINI